MSAWLSVGSYSGSRVDLTADSSSSLLHSIYGSQVNYAIHFLNGLSE